MANLNELIRSSDLIKRADEFSKKARGGQKRKKGEPYVNHPIAAAEAVVAWGLDEATVAAALLHDTIEDTRFTLQDVRNEFGDEVAFLVDGVTKIGRVRYRGVEAKVENLRKFILYLSQDIRVILVKLADRLKNVKERFEERERYSKRIRPALEKELKQDGIEITRMESRAKRYTSLYKKLLRYDMNVDSIYDLVAMRVIVKSVEDCYAALGTVHKIWPPVPHRFKDYIALPKANGYRSLHTTVFGPA